MKMKIVGFVIFLVTFFLGSIFIPLKTIDEIRLIGEKVEIKQPQPEIRITDNLETIEEVNDELDERRLKIKLLETGDGFHGDQVHAKSGQTWLGLFKRDNQYYLRKTKLTVSSVNDPIVDDEHAKTGKSVVTGNKDSAIFLLKNAKTLHAGEVRTIFYAQEPADSTDLKNGTLKHFAFNGVSYELRVVNNISQDEFLGKGSKLVLSNGNNVQTLQYLKDGCNDCYWNLYWVGDLDQDGKLDFFFDLSWHYNVVDKKLFLSSQAEKGKLVKYVANFWTNGC